ncbi:MAG TPA: tetratricopeptide repeat protein, partial [Polyangia bacterium]|nr:tetratricopeptide repeat protein [Polyangia bacterium]
MLASLASVAAAAPHQRDPAKEASYVAEISDKAEVFRAATAALDDRRLDEAERGFREVLAAHPKHGPTLWRLSALARVQGRTDEAIALSRRALEARPGWPARSTLIEALLSSHDSASMSEAERE